MGLRFEEASRGAGRSGLELWEKTQVHSSAGTAHGDGRKIFRAKC